MHGRPLGRGTDLGEQVGEDVEGGRQQDVIASIGRRGQRGDRHRGAIGELERFSPLLPRSTGLRPAHPPPPGALVMHPSTDRRSGPGRSVARRRPAPSGAGRRRRRRRSTHRAAAQRGRRAAGITEAFVATAEDQGVTLLADADIRAPARSPPVRCSFRGRAGGATSCRSSRGRRGARGRTQGPRQQADPRRARHQPPEELAGPVATSADASTWTQSCPRLPDWSPARNELSGLTGSAAHRRLYWPAPSDERNPS